MLSPCLLFVITSIFLESMNGGTRTFCPLFASTFLMADSFRRMPIKTCLIFVVLSVLNVETCMAVCQSLLKSWFLFVCHPYRWSCASYHLKSWISVSKVLDLFFLLMQLFPFSVGSCLNPQTCPLEHWPLRPIDGNLFLTLFAFSVGQICHQIDHEW